MSQQRICHRVPTASFVCVATLPEHQLRFHKPGKDGSGKCDSYETNNPTDSVIGVVHELDRSGKMELDKIEGLGAGYNEKWVDVSNQQGETLKAVTYYATHIKQGLKPYHWYKAHVLAGARAYALPSAYIQTISGHESISDPDLDRHNLEMAIYE